MFTECFKKKLQIILCGKPFAQILLLRKLPYQFRKKGLLQIKFCNSPFSMYFTNGLFPEIRVLFDTAIYCNIFRILSGFALCIVIFQSLVSNAADDKTDRDVDKRKNTL